jgi:hypothetical protein
MLWRRARYQQWWATPSGILEPFKIANDGSDLNSLCVVVGEEVVCGLSRVGCLEYLLENRFFGYQKYYVVV